MKKATWLNFKIGDMKKYLIRIFILLGACSVWACYDDKGNYDYDDLGEVVLKIKASETVMYSDSLGIVPEVSFKRTTEDQYDWSWEISEPTINSVPVYKEIADTKILCIKDFREKIGTYDLRFSAIHRLTGTRTMAYCKLVVDNGMSKAYLLLNRQPDGGYDIDAVTYPEGNVRRNKYTLINGSTVADAERLFYVNSSYSYDERLYLVQQGGGQTLSPIDLAYQGNATDWFFEAPEKLQITHLLTDMAARDQFLICNGGIYYMNNVNSPLKALGRSRLDEQDYNITGAGSILNSSGLGRYAFYDEKNGRFLEWKFDYGKYFLGLLEADASAPFNPQQINKHFVADISGKEDRLWCLFDDGTDMWLYTFEDGAGVYYNVTLSPYEAPVKLSADMREVFQNATAFCALKTADKFYYAVDNTIWIYNAQTHKTETEPFYSATDSKMRFSKIFYRDKDDPEITFAGNSEGKGYFYRVKVDYYGRIAGPTEKEPEPFKTYDGFGEIKDFVYKYKAY